MSRPKFHILWSGLLALALLASACAAPTATPAPQATSAPGSTQAPAATAAPQPTTAPQATAEAPMAESPIMLPNIPEPADVQGDIITAGSSTVFPVTEAMAELFEQEGYSGQVTVDSIGTGAGFERFCTAGETDISNASRAINAKEIAACAAIGRNPLEFRVGTDALAVVVSQDNDFVDSLTLAELAVAFSTATTWADVRAGWPAEPIQRFSPGTDSGTFDYFVEAVMAPANPVDGRANVEAGEAAILNSEGTQYSEDDNVLAQGVEGSPYALGYFGYAYYAAEAGKLKAVPIAKEDPAQAVAPDLAAVNAGTYPLARPLFIYSDAEIMEAKPQVAAFILFYLTNVNNEILDVGYFPASDNALGDAMANWLAGAGMTP